MRWARSSEPTHARKRKQQAGRKAANKTLLSKMQHHVDPVRSSAPCRPGRFHCNRLLHHRPWGHLIAGGSWSANRFDALATASTTCLQGTLPGSKSRSAEEKDTLSCERAKSLSMVCGFMGCTRSGPHSKIAIVSQEDWF